MVRHLRLIVLAIGVGLLTAAAPAFAQQAAVGGIEGVVTTQKGTILLGGSHIAVRDSGNQEVAGVLSDGDGRFRVAALPAGKYTVVVTLEGFATVETAAVIAAGKAASLAIDLPIAAVTASIEVIAPKPVVSAAETLGVSDTIGSKETDQLASGSGLGGALRLLASVIEVPGGLSIKGGRPTQSSVQMGASTLTDPVLGLVHLTLPDDAIDSVSVMPNPYAVEYGRFSSGLVLIQTRRAGDQWRVRLNNLSPSFRSERHKELYTITGLQTIDPTLELGGPLVKDRLFLEQTMQYRYGTHDIPSRPEDERRTTHWFSSFSRLDANLSPRHSIVATGGFFPNVTTLASLGTFTPPDATIDVHERVALGTVTERALWSDTLVSESTVQVRGYRTEVTPHGTAPMQLLPETTLGNFFNTQRRTPGTFQLVQTLAGSASGRTGLHLFKLGVDLLSNQYDGMSNSRPLLIARSNGALARRLEFSGPTTQALHSTDVALYAQDRVQPNARWYLEYGVRVDRDGVVARWNVTPRVGAALLLNESGGSVLRGGYGLFYERTPSAAGVFQQFETVTDTRFAADGVTSLAPGVPFQHLTASNLTTARSATWDVSYEYRWRPSFSFHAGVLNRRGSHELVLDSLQSGNAGTQLLDSAGTSRYGDVEVGFHFSHPEMADLTATYAHAFAEGDLNTFANFYDTMMWPIVAPNQRGPLGTDVPHRLSARGRLLPAPTWLITGVADWRTGLPYSIVDAYLDFVGQRDQQRLPTYVRLDLGVEHRFHLGKFRPWIGIRAYNALNAFLPSDVQANITSPAFGELYNSQFREFRIQVRFER